MSDRSSIMHSLPPQRKDNLRDGAAVSMAIRLTTWGGAGFYRNAGDEGSLFFLSVGF